MAYSLKPIEKLARELGKLPGIGAKTATRLAFHFVDIKDDSVEALSNSLQDVKRDISICPKCYGYSLKSKECDICTDSARDDRVLCVIQKPQDVFVIERGGFKGIYHVLHGVISPIDGIGPGDIKLYELIDRIKKSSIEEIIIALNPSVEGDATTLFIAKAVEGSNVRVSRLARGVPAGASIDYVDDLTLCRAIEERQRVTC